MQPERGAQAVDGAAPRPADPAAPRPVGEAAPTASEHGAARPGEPPAPLPIERKVLQLPGAVVAWWAWVILAVACLADIAVTGRDHAAAEIAVIVVAITGLVYACALRPEVIADSSGITVRNPLRDHRIPWGSVIAVDLKESVQVHCQREPGAKRGKVIYSWALHSQRRSRLRAELIGRADRGRLPRAPQAPGPATDGQAQKITRQSPVQIMAAQLDGLARDARERGAAAGPCLVTWAWQPAAAMLAPALVLVLVVTACH